MSSLIELNRLLTFEDIVEKYGGPAPLWEKLRPGLPIFCAHDGVPIYLESVVDEFLKALASGLQASSPPAVPEFGASVPSTEPEYISVAEAQRRYLNGEMSRKWWYRIVQAGKIAHHRVGDSILLRTDDIEAFIAESRKDRQPDEVRPAPVMPEPVVVPPPQAHPRKKDQADPSFFRIFPRR